VIEAKNLSRFYGDLCALSDLSFSVAPGEVLGLVGPNGAGKTTCLHCMSGIMPPSEGNVLLGGIDLEQDPVGAKRLAAYIPDTPVLFDHLTVAEHLQFVARVFQVQDWERRAQELLEEFELVDKRDELPASLSRGMKQKLAICQAFLHSPQAIFCDEPLSGLDPVGIHNMRASLKKRAADGAALILSSHQLDLVAAMCDRLLIIAEGKQVVVGTLDDVRAKFPQLAPEASLEQVFLAAIGRSEVGSPESV
jgi:ABC-2 type transport system ATP-binding protein